MAVLLITSSLESFPYVSPSVKKYCKYKVSELMTTIFYLWSLDLDAEDGRRLHQSRIVLTDSLG